MPGKKITPPAPRRGFLNSLANSAAALGVTALVSPFKLNAHPQNPNTVPEIRQPLDQADQWFTKLKGKHRVVFDATRSYEIFILAWPGIFLHTNGATGTPENECGVVVVLRHTAIPYAMEDTLWAAYKFGELFQANDPTTNAPSLRNPFWKPMKEDFQIAGLEEVAIGINELQTSGVMFCVCDAALTVHSATAAKKMGKGASEVKKEWVAGLLPGIQIVPSGVWALGRAQEHGCQYIYAG